MMVHTFVKRFVDILFSLGLLLLLAPLFLLIAVLIKSESKGPVLFRQKRVGKNNHDFTLLKFRSMYVDTEQRGQLTIGMRDPRITKVGYVIRRFKLDELPQFINVILGEMSIVGPRPEVRRYVDLYNSEQLKVLSIKPGITDYASVKYFNENELLGKSDNPEQTYIHEIMPEKLHINLRYVQHNTIFMDFNILLSTFIRFFSHP
jgi:lipopolysaccharide/colanic/teichoic acid biosynthesis glycosyltransferase